MFADIAARPLIRQAGPDTFSRKGRRILGLALALLAIPMLALAQPKFPPLTGRVVDDAHVLSPETQAKLTSELEALEQKTGRQLVVATVPDLQGYEIEEYGYRLGRTWAVGSKDKNDGAILLVAPKERKVRVEVGYGLEGVLTDALSSVILQSKVLPRFRDGQMEQGVVDGTEAIVQQLSLPDEDAKAQVAKAAEAPQQQGGAHVPIIFVIFILFWILAGLGGVFGRRGRGGGGGLWWLLPLLLSGGGRGGGGGWGGGGGGGGGFSGGGGSFGGGGSSGSW
jgi:uncharacterized protein